MCEFKVELIQVNNFVLWRFFQSRIFWLKNEIFNFKSVLFKNKK